MHKTAVSTRSAGLAVLLLGLIVLVGWALQNPGLMRVYSDGSPMVINGALCFVLCGLSLVVAAWRDLAWVRRLREVLLLAVIGLAGTTLLEAWFGLDLGIDLAELHKQYQSTSAYPGRMTPNAALAYCLFSIACLLHARRPGEQDREKSRRALMVLTGVVFMSGLTGIIAYLLDLQNLYPDWYAYTGIANMAFHTACGLIGLSIGLWGLWYHDWLHAASDQDIEVRRIYHSTATVIGVLGLATGITGFSFLQSTLQKENALNLQRMLNERRTYFETVLDYAKQRQSLPIGNPEAVAGALTRLRSEPDRPAALTQLRDLILPDDAPGFSGVAVETEGLREGPRRVLSGQMLPEGVFSVALPGQDDLRLAWHNGYFLQTRRVLVDTRSGQPLGRLWIEQALPKLDQSQADTLGWGQTGVMIVCGSGSPDHLACFPYRKLTEAGEIPDHFRRQPLAMLRALRQESGAGITFDADGQRVIAAYGPLAQTGLGMVVKMTVSEIYAPIRSRLEQALPVILFVMLLGLWLIHARVRPLVLKLVDMREKAERARSNFVAAAESSPDAFFILESCRDERGEIVDFRFAYLNHHVQKAFPSVIDDVTGRSFRERFAQHHDFFEKYRAVAKTGVMLVEEFDWVGADGTQSWINLQVVWMPNGVSVTWRDFTGRKQSERLLNESNRLRATIVDSAPYAIVTTNFDGIIIAFNRAAEQMLGYRADEVIGIQTAALFHDPKEVEDYALALTEELGTNFEHSLRAVIAKAAMGLPDEREWTYIRKDGSGVPVRVSMTAIRDELGAVTGFLGLSQDITEQKRIAEQTRYISLHDVLTGLPNRALLVDRVELAIRQSNRSGQPFALAMLDLDRFKHINDSLGHHVGDQVLIEFVRRITASLRPTDTVARMGGDEFVLLFPECNADMVALILDRIFDALKPAMKMDVHDLHVTTSIGISLYPDHGEDLSTLMRQADTAMYWVKEQGRNGYRIFSPVIDQGKEDRLRLATELHQAVEQGDFALFYQPLIDLRQRKVVGVEALLRWRKPDGSYVSPATFIPIAEDNGLILNMGAWVLNQACKDGVRFEEVLQTRLQMAVNVSPRQFVQGDLIDLVGHALDQSQFAPNLLELEITEGILMNQHINAADQLRALNALGVTIAIDDFGTGYSSLSYLKRFPISKLKIDQSFVRDVMTDPEDAVLAGAIISMGHSLNIAIVAEGVETRDQFEFLMRNWCDMGQGYYFARPMAFDDFVDWYRKRDFSWELEELEFIVVD